MINNEYQRAFCEEKDASSSRFTMLETTECIPICNNGRTYTDCMEFSLLRFLHILMHDPIQMQKDSCSDYMTSEHLNLNPELREFITKHSKIHCSARYYLSPAAEAERNEWATFVSGRGFFEYYRNDEAELFTNVRNVLQFLQHLVGLNVTYDAARDFNAVARAFASDSKHIQFYDISIDRVDYSMKMRDICRFLSKVDHGFTSKIHQTKDYKVIRKTSYIPFAVNNAHYQWELTELLIDDDSFDNKFITGHSFIRMM